MYHFRPTKLEPNLGHHVNQGKVAWFLNIGNNPSIIPDLIGTASAPITAGTSGAMSFGGPARPGRVGPALLQDQANPAQCAMAASPRLNNLSSGTAGFSIGYWGYNYAGTSTSFILNKGTVSSGVNGTGWALEQSSGQRPRFTIGRASSRESYGTADTAVVTKYTWVHVLWTWKAAGTTPVCYVNGISKAVNTIVIGSGVISPEDTTSGSFFSGSTCQTWLDDLCIWNRVLRSQEAWEAYQETASGYPNALLRRHFVFTTTIQLTTNNVTHTTAALLQATQPKTHTTNALLTKTQTKTHTTNALLKATFTRTHTTDASLVQNFIVTHTTDALLKKTQSPVHTTNASLQAMQMATHTTDASVVEFHQLTHTTNALLKKAQTPTHTTNALLKKAQTKTHTTDAKIIAANLAHITNALLYSLQTKIHTTDARLVRTLSQTHTTDALLILQRVFHTTNARLFTIYHGSGTLDFGEFTLSGHGALNRRVGLGGLTFPGFQLTGRGVFTPPELATPAELLRDIFYRNRRVLEAVYGWGSDDLTTPFSFDPCKCVSPAAPETVFVVAAPRRRRRSRPRADRVPGPIQIQAARPTPLKPTPEKYELPQPVVRVEPVSVTSLGPLPASRGRGFIIGVKHRKRKH